jgi:hypothetical protein
VGEVGEQPAAGIEDLRPHRNAQLDVLAVGAMAVRALPVAAAPRRVGASTGEGAQVAQIGIGGERDVSPVAAVAAVRPALGHVLLSPEGERAVAAAAAADADPRAVMEHRCA